MNKHILLVMKWLNDKNSVSKEELKDNRDSAGYASGYASGHASGHAYAANAAYNADYNADAADAAEKWVNKYFERSGENKQDYIDAIEEEKASSKEEHTSGYVKKYKGISVPEGATHYADNEGVISFYKKGAPRVERHVEPLCAADDPWSDCISNPTNELPKIEEEKVLTDTNKELSDRVEVIARNEPRYKGDDGLDWIDEFASDNSIEDFRAAMRFTIGKYEKRLGKKDDRSKELYKISDYYKRWSEVERAIELEGDL